MKSAPINRLALVSLLVLVAGPAFTQQQIVGYGRYPYDPLCAESCLRSFTSYKLECSKDEGATHAHDPSMMATGPDCFAQDTPFLTSVAWCLSSKCAEYGIATSKLEYYWEQTVTGSSAVPPKWSYQVALANVDPRPPTYQLSPSDTHLNRTSLVVQDSYQMQWNTLGRVYEESVTESKFSIAIIVTAVGIPLLLAVLNYLPFGKTIQDRAKPYLVYPSLIGTYQVRPLPFLLGNGPTVGQSIYIAIFVSLNVIGAAVEYQTRQPSAWFSSQWSELSAYILYRTGALACMVLPIILLFSSRNNILLWFSDWSHSTYLLLHRWVARVFMLYVVVHSIIGLQVYAHNANTTWWIWGAVATMATVLLTLVSGLYIRKPQYELFLISHILLAVFVIVGTWYHIILWYASMGMYLPNLWGYEIWLYLGMVLWFFDRLMRVVRVFKSGVRRAKVTDMGEGYVRVDIPGIRWGSDPGRHVYVYFPTLIPLRPWENHPFSVIPTYMLQQAGGNSNDTGSPCPRDDDEKQLAKAQVKSALSRNVGTGITLYIKKSMGITKHLRSHGGLVTLLEGPYSNNTKRDVLRCDRVLLIAGGIGITGVLPWAYNHWNTKLVWSVAESARCLVDGVDLNGVATKEVRIGRRFNARDLIAEEEDAGWSRIGVVVAGPGGLCDDVRAAVAAAGRRGRAVFELEVDAYSW